jgi:hypothetical protein
VSQSVDGSIERILVLCRAVPEDSKKYFQTVCVAGITDQGELRRLYPVVFRPFQPNGGIPFRKRDWIEARVLPPDDKRDTRPESRKLDGHSVKILGQEDYQRVRQIIQAHLDPSIRGIEKSGSSLGFIKPRLLGFDCEIESTEQWNRKQVDLEGKPTGRINLGQVSKYKFYCEERKNCCSNRPHDMEIHDWEANELYRNIIRRDTKHAVIREKMRLRLYDWMKAKRDVYFMMGTHHRWPVWMVVSVLYPPKMATT